MVSRRREMEVADVSTADPIVCTCVLNCEFQWISRKRKIEASMNFEYFPNVYFRDPVVILRNPVSFLGIPGPGISWSCKN